MSNTSQASKRISALLDENSFVEIGALVTARATDFDLKQTEAPSDGVITGYGVINGNLVYVYSQDASVLGGTIGEMHAKKIANLYDLAMKMGAPIIGLLDSAGLRLQESTDALEGLGTLYEMQACASGVIPQITAVFGNCGGGLAVAAQLSDFTFVESGKGKMFVNSPDAIDGNSVAKCDTSSAAFQGEAGNADVIGDEDTILSEIRELVSMLPSNNEDEAYTECDDDLNRVCEGLENCVGDPAIFLSQISDGGIFFETKRTFAKDMVTGFILLNGATVGAVANRTALYDEEGKETEKFDAVLSADGCEKAADFVSFCDAFEIPVLSLTNVKGFKACCINNEKRIAKAAAKLTYAFANASVPKVNVVVGKAFGSAYVTMNSKSVGADLVLAWPDAQIGTMDAKLAAKIMYEGQGSDVIEAKAAQYDALQNNVTSAARRGYVDQIVAPADTRKYVIAAFEMLYTKSLECLAKKHGTV